MGSVVSRKSNKSSASVPMSQDILQDSVLGPEVLEEASRHQGLDWIRAPEFVNSRLQRLELEHALQRNSHRCEAIVFQRTRPVATRPATSQDTLSQLSQADTNRSAKSPLSVLGEDRVKQLEATRMLKSYSLANTGADMGAFALTAAFAVIDALASNLERETQHTNGQQETEQQEAAAVQGSADLRLWHQEKKLQIDTLLALQSAAHLTESKLDSVTDLWKAGTGDDCSVDEEALGAFTRQECITQLVEWARGVVPSVKSLGYSSKSSNDSEQSSGALELGILRGHTGSGLSSTCAMLLKQLQRDSGDDERVLYYFRQSHRNNLGLDSFLLSEMRGQAPFTAGNACQVGLASLPDLLLQHAHEAGKVYAVVIDGLTVDEVATVVFGCGRLKHAASPASTGGAVRILVSLSQTHGKPYEEAGVLPQAIRRAISRVAPATVITVKCFEGLGERQRCAMLHTHLGPLASELSAPKALAVCRLQGASLPEFVCVAAAYLKDLSCVLLMDDAALALERTLEDLYEFNVIPWLELIHGSSSVQNAAEVLLQTRVFDVSMVQLGALLPARSKPRLLDAETVDHLASSLRPYCHLEPAQPTQALMLKSRTFRRALARRYRLKHHLDSDEQELSSQPEPNARSSARKSASTSASQKSVSSDTLHNTARLSSWSHQSLPSVTGGTSEISGVKDCDMDAVRSAMQALLKQKLAEQVQTRKDSKAVRMPRTPAQQALEASPPPEEPTEKKEEALMSRALTDRALTDTLPEPECSVEDKQLTTLLACRSCNGLLAAPYDHLRLYQLGSTAEIGGTSMRQKMSVEPTLYAIEKEDANQMIRSCSSAGEEEDSLQLEVQRMAMQEEVLHQTHEILSGVTHGIVLNKAHMWQPLQASSLMAGLDREITAAETAGIGEPVADMMLMKHRAHIASMKATKEQLIKLWAGATMDVLWRAVSVCTLDLSCRLEAVPPGVYKACWHLKFSAGISDFPDINCTLYGERMLGEQGAARAGPTVHRVLTIEQQHAVKTDCWCCVVVCDLFYVAEASHVVAGLECQGNWLSGLVIDAFALVPARNMLQSSPVGSSLPTNA